MPGEHELRIALATALRERDEAQHGLDEWCKAAMQERAENRRLETAARAYIEGHELALSRAETAESERDSYRTALQDIVTLCMDVPADEHWRAKVGDKARKALFGEAAWETK